MNPNGRPPVKPVPRRTRLKFQQLEQAAAKQWGIPPEELHKPNRARMYSDARAAVAFVARLWLDLVPREIGDTLACTPTGAHEMVVRGRRFWQCDSGWRERVQLTLLNLGWKMSWNLEDPCNEQ